jgi:hypothetical protein
MAEWKLQWVNRLVHGIPPFAGMALCNLRAEQARFLTCLKLMGRHRRRGSATWWRPLRAGRRKLRTKAGFAD